MPGWLRLAGRFASVLGVRSSGRLVKVGKGRLVQGGEAPVLSHLTLRTARALSHEGLC